MSKRLETNYKRDSTGLALKKSGCGSQCPCSIGMDLHCIFLKLYDLQKQETNSADLSRKKEMEENS